MATKYLFILFLALSLSIAGFALAEEASLISAHNTMSETTLACMKTAVEKRETAVATAFATFSATTTASLQTRKDALSAAWQIANNKDRAQAITQAHKAYQKIKIQAKKDYNKAVRTAWLEFIKDRKTCKAPATGENTSNDNL